MSHPVTQGAFAPLLPPREKTLGELIDAAALASHRFRNCRCIEDCPHDDAALSAEEEVKAYLVGKLGLTLDQVAALRSVL